MAAKRSRAAYEADVQVKASPYAIYGTPLPSQDSEVRDDGSFVPVWQQEVRDERGRKRLHGAFTGGFSAGYFNTVGSKEGWTPQTFVSSRSNRAKAQQKAEDFMDEEDLAEAEEARLLKTADAYSGLGSTADESVRKDGLMDLIRPAGEETMGVKLLQRMGWRPGQGVGPRVRRKARLGEDGADEETHLFAPEKGKMIGFVRKYDSKGLGFAGETSSGIRPVKETQEQDDEEDGLFNRGKLKLVKLKKKVKKSGFGVGILNDNGSDEEDPYEIGPKISYSRTIGGDKKAKKSTMVKAAVTSANPRIAIKPVSVSKKAAGQKIGFRKCHDGRLPLDGFVLSTTSSETPVNEYPPPKIPEGWKSSKGATSTTKPSTDRKSFSDAAKASSLDPKARAALLGEKTLPGKSVFDFISPEIRDRLAAATGKNLPMALGEAPPDGYKNTEEGKQKYLWSVIPSLDKDLAFSALQRGVNGWMPYAEDEAKRARYRGFLELKAQLRDTLPERAAGASVDEWKNELGEFAHAAEVFRPMTGLMASRFTSSSRTFEGSFNPGSKGPEETPLLTTPSAKPEDPAEAAANIGMYGPMTRSTHTFTPTKLLCKRFNVRPPAGITVDPGADLGGEAITQSAVKEVVSKANLEKIMQDAASRRFASGGTEGGDSVEQQQPLLQIMPPLQKEDDVDAERNEALEAERPGDAVFRAIFGSDDEDED